MSCTKHIDDKTVDNIFTSIETKGLEYFINSHVTNSKSNNENRSFKANQSESFEIKSEEYIELETIITIIKEFCWLTGFKTFVQTTSGYKSEKLGKTMLITISQSNYGGTFNTWISISYQPFSLLDLQESTKEKRKQSDDRHNARCN